MPLENLKPSSLFSTALITQRFHRVKSQVPINPREPFAPVDMVSSLIPAFVSGGTGPTQPTNWTSLPLELRQLILEFLTQQTSGWGACASVNKEWQKILEKESFRRLKLGVRCLDEMQTIVGPRQAKLTRQVWLNIELPEYTC